MTKHVAWLDGWRGVAILLVLLAHFGPKVPLDQGRLGVDLFFVLSGLLMSQILFERKTPIGTFYRRRVSRIIPVYLLFVLVMAVTYGITGWPLVSLLTFTSTYAIDLWHQKAPIGHLWSLNVEEHCYILLALIAALNGRAVVCLGLSALTLVAIALHYHFSPDPNASYLLNTECAATGLLASAGYRQIAGNVPRWAAPVAIGLAVCCYLSFAPWWLATCIAPLLLAFAVNHAGDSPLRNPLEWAPIGMLGLISYSVYLWQQPFYKYPLPYHLGIFAAMLVGITSFYLFESPVRRWLNANWAT